MHRRDFVIRLPVLTAGLAAGASALAASGCAGALHLVPMEAPGRLVVNLSALEGVADAFVQSPAMERPVYVRRMGDGFLALLARCTHRGCQPEPVADRLVCPCHGSEFAFDGSVLEGPAGAPLARYEVTVSGGELTIWTAGGRS